jgi:hypothetical protein
MENGFVLKIHRNVTLGRLDNFIGGVYKGQNLSSVLDESKFHLLSIQWPSHSC